MNKKQFCPIFVLQKAVVWGICFSKLKKMTFFHVLGLTVSRLQSHYEGQFTFYLFLFFTQENLILILIDLGRMKVVSQPWSHPVILNLGPLEWESRILVTRPLLLKLPSSAALKTFFVYEGHFSSK